MSSSLNYLFLLFLLLVIILLVFLYKVTRRHATRTSNLTPREEGSHNTTMSNESISRRNESDRWKALISESDAAIEKYLFPGIDIDLATFIRCVTFRAFVVVFLNVDPNPLVFTDVQQVTRAMSDFYNDKEGKTALPLDVQKILNGWLPRKRFPSSLHRILPAYEALWRIIATLVVTCEDDETRSLRWVMLDFRDNPRHRQYAASIDSDGRSVSAITDDAVGRLSPFPRPPRHGHSPSSNWPLSCIQHATPSHSTGGYPPTAEEALKFAALLASKIIGRVGVHYAISGPGSDGVTSSPWDHRKIFGVNVNGPIVINTIDMFPHASTSRQAH